MEIHDLGPLLVEQDGLPLAVGAGRLAAVLSPLAHRVGDLVTTTALVGAVWGTQAPPRATQLLESLIWRLRKQLEPGRIARAESVVLRREPHGYRLELPASAIDSARLRGALPEVRELSGRGRHEEVLEVSTRVLALWRGQPYAEVPDTGWLAPARESLEQARLDLSDLRVHSLLESGRPEEALGELGPLLADHPMRERLWAHRMVALYRAGRQGDALAAYRQARDLLADELGVDPGAELRELHRRVLDHDPTLDLQRSTPRTRPSDHLVHVPRRRTTLIGRDDDRARLESLVGDHSLITLVGPGGAGKTRLAVEVGHDAAPSFPGGVWFVDLASVGDGGMLVSALASTLGLADQPGRAPLEVVTHFLADRRTLLVLDNCEHVISASAAAVEEILARCPSVCVLTTTREPLDLPGEQRYPVGPVAVETAVALFADRAGPSVQVEPDGRDRQVVRRICAAVGDLPLGIELAAAATRSFELEEIAETLERNPAALSRPGSGPQRQASLRDAVDWGYRLARGDEQVLHRRLAVVPGPFSLDVAAMLCGVEPLDGDRAMELVGGLVHRSLLTSERAGSARRASIFAQLAPVRAHAAGVLSEDERDRLELTRDRWLAARVAGTSRGGRSGEAAFLSWLDDNVAVLRATLESTLAGRPDRSAITLVGALVRYWYERGRLTEAAYWAHRLGELPGRVACDELDLALIDATLGSVYALQHRVDEATVHLTRALPVLRHPSPDRVADVALALADGAAAAWTGDAWSVAQDYVEAGLELGRQHDQPHLVIVCQGVQSANWAVSGDPVAGIARAREVLADNEHVGNDVAVLFALVTLTVTALVGGRPDAALESSDQLLLTHRRMGSLAVGDTIETRAAIRAAAGDAAGAVRCLGAASALSRRLGREWPWHEFTPPVLAGLRAGLEATEFDRHWSSGERLGLGDPSRFTPEWI